MYQHQEETLREHLRIYRQLKASHHSHYMSGSAKQEQDARYALEKQRLTIIDFLEESLFPVCELCGAEVKFNEGRPESCACYD